LAHVICLPDREQLSLPLEAPASTSPDGKLFLLDDRFWRFHEANPQVYRQLRRLAFEAVRKGRNKIGMKMLFEVLRWEVWMQTEGEDWKLNNSYTSRYARLLMDQERDLAGLFETRMLKS